MNKTYDQFLDILSEADEPKMLAFLETHLKELPEDLQEKVVFALFEDSVAKDIEQTEALASAQKEGLDILAKLQEAKKNYEEAQKIEAIKTGLGA
jgi:hypothetical protein